MAQFLLPIAIGTRRTEKAELDRYPDRAAMLSLLRFGSYLSRYNCLGISAKNCAKQITPTVRVSNSGLVDQSLMLASTISLTLREMSLKKNVCSLSGI